MLLISKGPIELKLVSLEDSIVLIMRKGQLGISLPLIPSELEDLIMKLKEEYANIR